jgi:hypothetical protein
VVVQITLVTITRVEKEVVTDGKVRKASLGVYLHPPHTHPRTPDTLLPFP